MEHDVEADTERPPPDLYAMVAQMKETVDKVYATVNKVHAICQTTQKVAQSIFDQANEDRKRILDLEADVAHIKRVHLHVVGNGAAE